MEKYLCVSYEYINSEKLLYSDFSWYGPFSTSFSTSFSGSFIQNTNLVLYHKPKGNKQNIHQYKLKKTKLIKSRVIVGGR